MLRNIVSTIIDNRFH